VSRCEITKDPDHDRIILPSHTLHVNFEHRFEVHKRLGVKLLIQLRYLCGSTFCFFVPFCCCVCDDDREVKKRVQELRIKKMEFSENP
jgi:hypothetical protein